MNESRNLNGELMSKLSWYFDALLNSMSLLSKKND
jgi:hypothetical protein